MNAPDRSAEVVATVEQHRGLFGTDDTRRGILFYICRDLNDADRGNWGVLRKLDQGGFIPSDIICWAPTREIFDVLAGAPDRPSWQPLGPVQNPQWVWASSDVVKPASEAPAPAPAPPDPLPFPSPPRPSPEEVLTGVEVLKDALESLDRFVHAVEVIADAVQRINETLKAGVHLDVKAHL